MPNLTVAQTLQIATQNHQAGRLAEAEKFYRQVLEQQPNNVDALHLLGALAGQVGQLDTAIDLIGRAVRLHPIFPEAFGNLASALALKGRLDEAIDAFNRAIQLKPANPDAYNGLGGAFILQGRLEEAIAAFSRAIQLRPDFAEAHTNLGNAMKDQGKLDEAIAAYRHAISLNPNYADAHGNVIFVMNYHPACDPQAIAEESRSWDRQHGDPLKKSIEPHTNNSDPDRRLRIGYVSADFRDHASARFLDPLLRSHDHHHFEIFCYAQVHNPDSLTQQFQGYADHWHNTVGLSDNQLAHQIRQDKIDILVDLKLHTAENRLMVFACKPAPVQVSWLGHPGSTGLSAIDYHLTDPYMEPADANDEQAIKLPDCFWCYDPLTNQPPVNDLPALKNGFVTFGSLNNFCKVNDRVLQLWGTAMAAVPDSRLLMLAPPGDCRQTVLNNLRRQGVTADRVEFAYRLSRAQYLQQYHRIDLGLDCFPYNGHTTSLDSFWMGVPVVTLIGRTAISRAGWSQLSNLGLGNLAAQTDEQFVRIAVNLAKDLHKLQKLRSSLRQRMQQSPLMDAPRFARNIEAAYRQMWRKWCERR